VDAATLRKCALQAQVNQGQRSGPTSEDLAEIKRPRAENRGRKEADEIPKAGLTPARPAG
jgi:hypothetical protein